jgi:disulfide bond formation protein DsbB
MSQRAALIGLLAASFAALALAYWVQYGLGYPPCNLCVRARLPHYALLAGGLAALWLARPGWGLWLALGAFLAAFAISLGHVGVETGWLPLPGGCQAQAVGGGLDDLRTALMAQTQPSCDQPGPRLLGISMPTWHAAAALILALGAALALTRSGRRT